MNKAILDGEYYNFKCPHCDQQIQVHKNDVNCRIFRHAAYKHNLQPINPHMPKMMCDFLVNNNKVFGCAKPFQLIPNNDSYDVVVCDYI